MSMFNKIALVMATICTTSIIEAQPLKNKILVPDLQVPHLFVLFDTGETEFLAPVISRLESEGKDYRVLVMGTAEGVIKRKGLPENKVIALSSLGVDKVIDKTSSRFETLNESELEVIHSHLKTSNLVVGFASMIQKQLAIEYASDARTFMVWDNFVAASPEDGDAFKVAHQIQHVVDTVLYPSNYVASNMQNRPDDFEVVGHPSLQSFCEDFAKINPSEIRDRLVLDSDQKVVAYLGGWSGDKDYQRGFELFAQCLKNNPFQDDLFIIQPHPKSGDGAFEKSILQKYGVTNFLIPPEKTVNTQEVVSISSGPVICHKSTVGIKVAALGKEVIHVLASDDEYSNALLDAKASPRISSSESLCKALLSSSEEQTAQDLYTMMIMPKDASDQVYNQIVGSVQYRRQSA